MVQMLDSWSVEEREHSIAKMMLMDVDKSPKAIEGCSQGRRLLSNLNPNVENFSNTVSPVKVEFPVSLK